MKKTQYKSLNHLIRRDNWRKIRREIVNHFGGKKAMKRKLQARHKNLWSLYRSIRNSTVIFKDDYVTLEEFNFKAHLKFGL